MFIFIFIFSECSFQLGLENGTILDEQINASSAIEGFEAKFVRLNLPNKYWFPVFDSSKEWIQIDLRDNFTVTGLVVQGPGESRNNWVTKCKVKYLRLTGTYGLSYIKNRRGVTRVS